MSHSIPTRQTFHSRFLLGALGALFLGATAHSAVIVNDTFADNSRTVQNLPDSVKWYSSNDPGHVTVANNTMTAVGSVSALGYTTASGSPTTLIDGQTMTLTIHFVSTFTTAPTSDNTIRFGLFNSTGSRVSADGGGPAPSSGVYSPYVGYLGGIGTGLGIYERIGGNDNLINSINTAAYSRLNTGAALALVSGTAYTYTMELERSGADMIITSSLTGGALSGRTITATDSASAFYSFDTIVLYAGSTTPTMAYSGIELSVVPEPGTFVMLLGGLGMLAMLRRRRA